MTSAAARWGAFLVALGLCGCNAWRSFIATPNDYADYRRVRLAASFDERLAAAWYYLGKRPDGRYTGRLRDFFAAAEPIYFKARSQTVAGLEAYLVAMPDGPHAKVALDALIVKRNEARRAALAERAALAMLRKIEAEEKSRKGVAGMVEWWVRALLDPAPWHGTFSDAPSEMLARFRLSAPRPECSSDDGAQHCHKRIERRFRIRDARGEIDETLIMSIDVWLDAEYHLQRVQLAGPLLALRSRQAAQGEGTGEHPKEIAAAWRALVEQLNQAIMADNRICNGGEDAAEVLSLQCEDPAVTLTVAPGWKDGNDSVTIARPRRLEAEAP